MFVNLNKICLNNDRTTEIKGSSVSTTLHSTPVQQSRTRRDICGRAKDGDAIVNNDRLYCRSNRLSGGVHHNAAKNIILSTSQCKLHPTDMQLLESKNPPNIINLVLTGVPTKATADDLKLPQGQSNVGKNRTRATQTLLRDSSAQTLPCLSTISNNPAQLDFLEIYKLPTILTGNGSPGLYEVEVLERSRKRWTYTEVLKNNFRKQLNAAKDQAKLQKHEYVLEAFEWEHWIEREENIQECQMLRLELVIKMLDKRERDMHINSKTRIRKSYQDIKDKRNSSLKKNDMKYNRDIRCLNIKHKKQPRVWDKKSITEELIDPSSEFYASELRYGINSKGRHYVASRNDFDIRIDNLGKQNTPMHSKNIKCPFSKLRQWAKPKEILHEVEQNFCSDANLNRLYDSLRTLRESSKKHKYTPLCLKTKKSKNPDQIEQPKELTQMPPDTGKVVDILELLILDDYQKNSQSRDSESLGKLWKEKQIERLNMEKLLKEMRCEELETLISSYQGNTIGWLMRFLTEEICRLNEQRKLQFLTMLAKRKRWRNEAAEAGLRQKENCVRETYEKIYKKCSEINGHTTQEFLDSLLKTDITDYARQSTKKDIANLAGNLYKEISGWLKSFDDVQNPLNYQILRRALKDIVMSEEKKVLYRLERDDCIDYIINDILMKKVNDDLESYDITFSLLSDCVDRLTDTDLFLNSSDCSSDSECVPYCDSSRSQQEAKAIIRKVLRRAVPGRRWLTEEERITRENICELLDDVCHKIIKESGIIEVDMRSQPHTSCGGAHIDLVSYNKDFSLEKNFEPLLPAACKGRIKLQFFKNGSNIFADNITKSLKWSENLLLADPDKLLRDDCLVKKTEYILPEATPKLSVVHTIPSYYDLSSIGIFGRTPTFAQTSTEELLENVCSEQEEIRVETSLLNEDCGKIPNFIEQLECEKEQLEDESSEVNSKESFDEEQKPSYPDKDTQLFSSIVKEPSQQFSKQQTIQISEKSIVEHVDIESIQEEDDASGFMRVSFTYDPRLNFSVAMPTYEDDHEVNH